MSVTQRARKMGRQGAYSRIQGKVPLGDCRILVQPASSQGTRPRNDQSPKHNSDSGFWLVGFAQ